jgi:hypothetical protein
MATSPPATDTDERVAHWADLGEAAARLGETMAAFNASVEELDAAFADLEATTDGSESQHEQSPATLAETERPADAGADD